MDRLKPSGKPFDISEWEMRGLSAGEGQPGCAGCGWGDPFSIEDIRLAQQAIELGLLLMCAPYRVVKG